MIDTLNTAFARSAREEVAFRLNLTRNIGYTLALEAFGSVIREQDPFVRQYYMTLILNSLMTRTPSEAEVVGLLDAIFDLDGFDPRLRHKLNSNRITVTLAGS